MRKAAAHSCARGVLLVVLAVISGCDGNPAPGWDGVFSEPVARPEHPRPDLQRASFISLNTTWKFAYDPDDVGLSKGWADRGAASIWTDEIQVPFAWESPLSGLAGGPVESYRPLGNLEGPSYRGVAWYRLSLPGTLPEFDDGQSWHVVFGAVDFRATVFVNGEEIFEHEGGYAPFAVDLGPYLSGDSAPTIVLRVEDYGDLEARGLGQPLGKQGGFWYTPTSGIWQTVYLERRPAVHVASYRVLADPSRQRAIVRVQLSGDAPGTAVRAIASLDGEVVGEEVGGADGSVAEIDVPLADYRPWEPTSPTLYDLQLEVSSPDGTDQVRGYFGLAVVGADWVPGHGPDDGAPIQDQYQAITLNGVPRYLRCVLDQSYWPDGIMTAPSEAAIRADLELARDLGFNCIRVHVKADEPIKYRVLDELGLLTIYDLVSLDLRAANREAFEGRRHFERHLRSLMARDAMHPSIVQWVIFNENWGLSGKKGGDITPLADDPNTLTWAQTMVQLARQVDPTRPVEDNSAGGLVGRYEHFDTDVNSFHWYGEDVRELRAVLDLEAENLFPGSPHNFVGAGAQTGAPWLISELAAFSFLGAPRGDPLCTLWRQVGEVRRQPKLAGYVLTQLTDVEFEQNGLVEYDRTAREPCERDGVGPRDVLGPDAVIFDSQAGTAVAPGEELELELRYSHWSERDTDELTLRAHWVGQESVVAVPFEALRFSVVPVTLAGVAAPATRGPAVLVVEVVDAEGVRLTANRLPIEVR